MMERIILVLLAIAAIIAPAAAYTISDVTITPPSNIVAGEAVSLSFTLTPSIWFNLEENKHYTADPNNTIVLATSLDNPSWSRTMGILGHTGLPQVTRTNTLYLYGWDLGYLMQGPVNYKELVNITLTGTAPNITETGMIPFVSVAEYGHAGEKLPNDQRLSYTVINRRDLASAIYLAESDLKKFKEDINAQEWRGIDTSAEQSLYDSSLATLGTVRNMPPDQYGSAVDKLNGISDTVKAGEIALDKAWAARDLENSTAELAKTDEVIEWFRGNRSTYPGLSDLVNQRNNVSITLQAGYEYMNAGNGNMARESARSAYVTGNLTEIRAKALQKRAMDPLTPLYDYWYIVAGMIVAGIGTILFRKPKKKGKKNGKQAQKLSGTEEVQGVPTETSADDDEITSH